MSEQDQTQPPTGHEQTRESQKPQGERSGSGSGERGGGSSRHGRRRHSGGGGGGGGGGARPSQPQSQPSRRSDASLNMDELRELMDLFTSHGLTDLEFENEDIRVRLSKNAAPQQSPAPVASLPTPGVPVVASSPAPNPSGAANATTSASPSAATTAGGDAAEKSEDLHVITSPIVGTFYRSPSPTAESFVRAGSRVEAGYRRVHHRSDEVDERDSGRNVRHGRKGLRRKRPARRIRPAAFRYQEMTRFKREKSKVRSHRDWPTTSGF